MVTRLQLSRTPHSAFHRRVLRTSLALTGACAWLFSSPVSLADILTQYTFGPDGSATSTLFPTTVIPNAIATEITGGTGNTLDVSNSQTPPPVSAPWLRVVPTGGWINGDGAVANNGYFEFSLVANGGFLLDLASIAFDVMRGGGSTPRGYDVRTSLDNYAVTIGTAAAATQRPTFTNVTIDLSTPFYQDLSSITFRIYSYSPASGASVEYDNITVNGALQSTGFTGYTWTGSVNGSWNTTTANWSGVGTIYPDGLPTSNVMFNDSAITTSVTVDAQGLTPNAVTFENTTSYTLAGGAVNITTGLLKDGPGTTTIANAVTAASATVANGTLAVGVSGSLSATTIAVSSTGTLVIESGGVLAETTAVQLTGNLFLNAATQTLAALNGPASGMLTLNGTTLTATNTSSFAGTVTGTGSILKNTPGTLSLGGSGNDYSGGTTISAGAVQFTQPSAAGTGSVVVEPAGTLILGAPITAPLVLTGGTVGVSAAVTFPGNFPVANDITVTTYNPATGAGSADLILTGMLQGSGDINFLSINGNNPDSQAFRLRGPTSDYSGTITLGPSAKFEIQTSTAVGSPMGTGSLVLTGGTVSTTAAGTYSLVNVRNNSAAGVVSDALLANNVRMQGLGTAYFNMLGSALAGSVSQFGDLEIGEGQEIGAVATTGGGLILGFSTVHLTGGNASFVPQPIGNTGFIAAHNIRLGTITETVPGSGIVMNGAATLTLTGQNTYTGNTLLRSGTTVLAAGASIASTNAITIEAGATLDTSPQPAFEFPQGRILTVNGTLRGTVLLAGTLFGSGTINGPLTALSSSLISTNETPGILTFQNLTLETGAVLQMKLSKAIPGAQPLAGSDYDSLVVTNTPGGLLPTLQVGGTLDLIVGTGLEVNDVFGLISNLGTDSVLGNFEGIPHGATFVMGGASFQISYNDDGTTPAFELSGGNDVSLLVVPEPGSAGLILGGLAACAIRRTRIRRSSGGSLLG